MIKFQFKNTNTHEVFEKILDINEKIDKIRAHIANNVFTEFNLEINEFDLIESGIYGENGFPLKEYSNENNLTLLEKYNKNINTIAFYIKPRVLINSECPVCYQFISFWSSDKIFHCSHMLCNECHMNWLNKCTNNNRVFNCPVCRRV